MLPVGVITHLSALTETSNGQGVREAQVCKLGNLRMISSESQFARFRLNNGINGGLELSGAPFSMLVRHIFRFG